MTRKFSGTGVGLLCLADQAFLQFPNKEIFVFLFVANTVSKYARPLAKNNPKNLKRAFKAMFKTQNCPYFPIIKVDKDKNMFALRTFFFFWFAKLQNFIGNPIKELIIHLDLYFKGTKFAIPFSATLH